MLFLLVLGGALAAAQRIGPIRLHAPPHLVQCAEISLWWEGQGGPYNLSAITSLWSPSGSLAPTTQPIMINTERTSTDFVVRYADGELFGFEISSNNGSVGRHALMYEMVGDGNTGCMNGTTQPTTQPTGRPGIATDSEAATDSRAVSPGAIAGIVVGVVVALILLGVGIYLLRRRKTKRAAQGVERVESNGFVVDDDTTATPFPDKTLSRTALVPREPVSRKFHNQRLETPDSPVSSPSSPKTRGELQLALAMLERETAPRNPDPSSPIDILRRAQNINESQEVRPRDLYLAAGVLSEQVGDEEHGRERVSEIFAAAQRLAAMCPSQPVRARDGGSVQRRVLPPLYDPQWNGDRE